MIVTFLILNLSLNVFNGIIGFDLKSDGLPSEGLDEDLHSRQIFILDQGSLPHLKDCSLEFLIF